MLKNLKFHFIKSNAALSELESNLQKILDAVGERTVSMTEAVRTKVVIQHCPEECIPELGISGRYTNDAKRIDIFLDLDSVYLKENLEQEITRTFVHEYMHALREQYLPWENGTLLDSLIAEGLTQSFEIEVLPTQKPALYATAFTEGELNELWGKAEPVLQEKNLSDDWFFGNAVVKRWSGYSLGYKLVQNKIKESGLKASQLYKLPSTDFLP
jgi:hypothetical protein